MALKNQLKAVLIDLSGTLHVENQVTPGAVEALKRYRIALMWIGKICVIDLSFFKITIYRSAGSIPHKYHQRIQELSSRQAYKMRLHCRQGRNFHLPDSCSTICGEKTAQVRTTCRLAEHQANLSFAVLCF